jgi:arylsulfatase A-like enzyme
MPAVFSNFTRLFQKFPVPLQIQPYIKSITTMNKINTNLLVPGLLIASIASSCENGGQNKTTPVKPNIIYILADDLGYGELGCYGQTKIETPNIDALAANGMIFTQNYTGSPVCAPARSILLTGMHSGKSQVRGNDEWRERGEVWDYRAMIADSSLEGQRPLKENTYTIGRMLQSAGYKTAIVGKWGLGAPHTEGVPNKQGFDYFYGYNCQRQAHTLYPVHLWENDRRVHLNNDTIAPNTRLAQGADPLDEASYAPFRLNDYAPDFMFSALSRFIEENRSQPFFLYWATPVPHAPLQAPQRWVDYYVKKFGDEKPYLGEKGYFPHRYPRAAYAAMVSHLDEQVGKLADQLKTLGIYENTVIIFTSDNGPTFNGGTDSPWFNSAGPFRSEQGYGKGYLHEGGIRVPMIASWPGVIQPGSVSHHPTIFYDVMPTLAEIAGIVPEVETDGISFLSSLKGEKQEIRPYLYWEFPEYGGQMAVRIGNMKALRKEMHKGNKTWELFDLENDPAETTDISARHPEIIEQVETIVAKEHTVSPNARWQFKYLDE